MGKTPPATGSPLPPPNLKHSEPKTSSVSSGKETTIGCRLSLKTRQSASERDTTPVAGWAPHS